MAASDRMSLDPESMAPVDSSTFKQLKVTDASLGKMADGGSWLGSYTRQLHNVRRIGVLGGPHACCS